MMWSLWLICLFIFFVAVCCGRAWRPQGRTFLKGNKESPHMSCFKTFQWSFALFLNTATHSILMPNLTMTTFATFSTISYYERDTRMIWHSIGISLMRSLYSPWYSVWTLHRLHAELEVAQLAGHTAKMSHGVWSESVWSPCGVQAILHSVLDQSGYNFNLLGLGQNLVHVESTQDPYRLHLE